MSTRAIRRAAERKAMKLSRKPNAFAIGNQSQPSPQSPLPATFDFAAVENATGISPAQEPETSCFPAMIDQLTAHRATTTPAVFVAAAGATLPEPQPISPARLAANRANAALSSGPKTPAGKAKSSLNAVKTGLTGRTVLLPNDDAAIYQQHLDRHFSQYLPALGADDEKALIQCIADTEWRLLRIAPLEAGIYAVGHRELAEEFPDEQNLNNREALIQAKIFMTYRKDLSNLALQERRLRNQRAADIAQLERLQKERRDKDAANRLRAQNYYKMSKKSGIPFDPAFFGFVFSIAEIADHLHHEQAKNYALGAASEFDRDQFDAYVAQWRERQAA